MWDACASGNMEQLKLCIEEDGDNPSAVDDSGWTCIHHAGLFGHTIIIEYLIEVYIYDYCVRVCVVCIIYNRLFIWK